MTPYILFGATGFVGSNIATELTSQRKNWFGVASRSRDSESPIVAIDDTEKILGFLKKSPVLINASGGLKPRDYEARLDRAMDQSWRNLERLSDLIRACPPQSIVHISSAGTVYGEANNGPSTESDAPRPSSWYGRMKLIEESVLKGLATDLDIPYCCARVSNPFGNKLALNHGLIDVLIDRIRHDYVFTASFRQGATRDFIHAPEMAKMILKLADNECVGTFNIGSGTPTSLEDLLELAREVVPEARIEEGEASERDVKHSIISTSKFDKALGAMDRGPSAMDYLRSKLAGEFV